MPGGYRGTFFPRVRRVFKIFFLELLRTASFSSSRILVLCESKCLFSNTVGKNMKTPQDLSLSIVAVNLLSLKLI